MKVIVYKQESGSAAMLIPTVEGLGIYTIEQVALKDVPAGLPFGIFEESELPDAPIEEWDIDSMGLVDGHGAE